MKLLYSLIILSITSSAFSQKPNMSIPECADISVSGIYLDDSSSVIDILGRNILKPKEDFTGTHFYNKKNLRF